MNIKTISLGKEMTVNLGNYSNIKPRVDITFEFAEGEQPNFEQMWDMVNSQLFQQVEGLDPSWIESNTLKDSYKTIIRVPK